MKRPRSSSQRPSPFIGALVSFAIGAPGLAPTHARAQSAIDDNDYAVEVVTGPVLGGGRVVGLAGSYSALAVGIEGAPFNPASYASRYAHEFDWFEYDLDLGIMLPGTFSKNDYFNNDQGEGIGTESFLFIDFGLRLQFAQVGLGQATRIQSYRIGMGDRAIDVAAVTTHQGLGYAVQGGQLVIGAGLRVASLTLSSVDATELVAFDGTNLELGILARPDNLPFRIGGAFRFPVESTAVRGEGVEFVGGRAVSAGFVLPTRVVSPWEAQVGVAIQLGPRSFNRGWNPERLPDRTLRRELELARYRRLEAQTEKELIAEGTIPSEARSDPYAWLPRVPRDPAFVREERLRRQQEEALLDENIDLAEEALEKGILYQPRQYVILTAELLIVGASDNAVGLDAFMDQEHRQAGENASFHVRVGAEAEPFANLLRLRIGSYLEPSRYEDVAPRVHGTAGFDLRLFRFEGLWIVPGFDVRFTGAADIAARYFNWGAALGFWH